jgi:hypothetical protein
MELNKLKANPTTRVELIHPDEGETGIFITLASKDHPDVLKVVRRAMDRRLAEMAKGGKKSMTSVDIETESLEILAMAIQGWEGLERDGDTWPCTPENVRELLEHRWIRRQLDEAMNTEALFFGR